ncbi:Vps5 C terminal like-domain-containing protein [Syncephalis fuscata]|nr:Vps5 C terminal like-domain-containing protein [Syncephalis fuscata]
MTTNMETVETPLETGSPLEAAVKIGEVDRSRREAVYVFEFTTNLRQYKELSYNNVRREYSEFARLYQHLVAAYPGCITPTLPSPRSSATDSDWNDKEMCAVLELFLSRIVVHPLLSKDVLLQQFIEQEATFSPPVTMQEVRRRPNKLFSNLKARVAAFSPSPATPIKTKQLPSADDPLYDKLQKQATGTEKDMSMGSRAVEKMAQMRRGLVVAHVDVASKTVHLGGAESDPLLANGLRKLGKCLQEIGDIHQTQADVEAVVLGDFLNHQMHDAHCIYEVLDNRKQLFEDHSVAVDRVEKRKQTVQQLKSSVNVRQERVNDSVAELEEAERYEQFVEQQCRRVTEQLRQELALHQKHALDDTHRRFRRYANEQLRLERQMLHSLQDLEPDIQAMFEPLGSPTRQPASPA